MMKSLLNKNLMQFIGCMLVILILVTPLFYLTTKDFYAEEMLEAIDHIRKGKAASASDMEEDIVEGMVVQLLFIFAAMSLSLLLVMRFLTRRMWKPFDDTLAKIEHFNLERSDIPQFMKSGTTEFERLNSSVEKLMRKDKDTYRSQKEFTENASHELQTPIAVIKGKLDLLMQENLTQSQSVLVADMYDICNRLTRLNKSLLMLAKIENEQYGNKEKVMLKPFIQKRIPLYGSLNADGNISLDETSADILVSANMTLLECLIDNLVVNAIRHKPANTDVNIRIEGCTLSVINKGFDDKPLDKSLLFRRFSNNRDKNRGNGLGLAIVKAICDFHHWTVDYQFSNGCHHFIVRFYLMHNA